MENVAGGRGQENKDEVQNRGRERYKRKSTHFENLDEDDDDQVKQSSPPPLETSEIEQFRPDKRITSMIQQQVLKR